jgi:hypothetical protein
MYKTYLIIGLACASRSLFAEVLPENFTPVRPLGMGNAFTAVANDESAIWTNPAGVSRARKARTRDFYTIKAPNIGLGANKKGQALYQSQAASGGSSLAETVAENGDLGNDSPYWANLQMFPVALFDYSRNLVGAFGLFSHSTTNMLIESETPDQARVDLVADTGGVTNLTWTSDQNRFSAGLQLRYTMRYSYEDTVPTDDITNKSVMVSRIKDEANSSAAIGLDFGMLYTLADFWFPTIGFSILNLPLGCKTEYLNPHSKVRETVCGAVYSGDIPNEDALSTVDPTDLRVGFAITPRVSRDLSLRIGLDAHHLPITVGDQNYGLSGVDSQKLLHAGAELFIGNPLEQAPLAFRAGVNQGFMTVGFGFSIASVAIDFASYGADVSSTAKQIEDRRYIGSITMSF